MPRPVRRRPAKATVADAAQSIAQEERGRGADRAQRRRARKEELEAAVAEAPAAEKAAGARQVELKIASVPVGTWCHIPSLYADYRVDHVGPGSVSVLKRAFLPHNGKRWNPNGVAEKTSVSLGTTVVLGVLPEELLAEARSRVERRIQQDADEANQSNNQQKEGTNMAVKKNSPTKKTQKTTPTKKTPKAEARDVFPGVGWQKPCTGSDFAALLAEEARTPKGHLKEAASRGMKVSTCERWLKIWQGELPVGRSDLSLDGHKLRESEGGKVKLVAKGAKSEGKPKSEGKKAKRRPRPEATEAVEGEESTGEEQQEAA